MKSLSEISKSITLNFPSIGRVVISKRKTAPRIGTHLRNVDCIHGGTNAKILKGFKSNLTNAETVKELKQLVCKFLFISGYDINENQFVVLGGNTRVLHGSLGLN